MELVPDLQVGRLGHFIAKTKSRNNTGFKLSSKFVQLCSLRLS